MSSHEKSRIAHLEPKHCDWTGLVSLYIVLWRDEDVQSELEGYRAGIVFKTRGHRQSQEAIMHQDTTGDWRFTFVYYNEDICTHRSKSFKLSIDHSPIFADIEVGCMSKEVTLVSLTEWFRNYPPDTVVNVEQSARHVLCDLLGWMRKHEWIDTSLEGLACRAIWNWQHAEVCKPYVLSASRVIESTDHIMSVNGSQ